MRPWYAVRRKRVRTNDEETGLGGEKCRDEVYVVLVHALFGATGLSQTRDAHGHCGARVGR